MKINEDCNILPPCACIFLLSDMFSSFWGTILLLLGRGSWVPGVGPGLLLKYSIFRAFNDKQHVISKTSPSVSQNISVYQKIHFSQSSLFFIRNHSRKV